MLKAVGYDVVSEYYINDAGRQMKLLGASVYARYEELSNRPVEFPPEGYHGAYITAVAEQVKQQLGPELAGRIASEVEERLSNVRQSGIAAPDSRGPKVLRDRVRVLV